MNDPEAALEPTTDRLSGRLAAIAVLVLAVAYGFAATQIEYAFSSDPIGPRGFPLLLAGLLGLFAVLYLVRPGTAEPWPNAAGFRSILAFMTACVVSIAAMDYIGFVPAMTLLLSLTAWLFGAKPWLALTSGLAQALVWWAVFGPLVGGNLPKGPLGL